MHNVGENEYWVGMICLLDQLACPKPNCIGSVQLLYEPVREKTNNLGSDQVRHKPGCTVAEDGKRLEILDLESRGIVRIYCKADLRLCFRLCRLLVFACGGSYFEHISHTSNHFKVRQKAH